MPPAALAALQRGAQSEIMVAATLAAFGVIGIGLLWMMAGPFALVFLGIAVPVGLGVLWSSVSRAFKLTGAHPPGTIVRVVGPVTVTKHRADKSYSHIIHLADGTRFRIDRQAFRKLEDAGELRVEEAGLFNREEFRRTPDGFLETQHEIPAATTTFEPSTQFLLEIRNPFGGTVYRNPNLREGDLGPFEPTI